MQWFTPVIPAAQGLGGLQFQVRPGKKDSISKTAGHAGMPLIPATREAEVVGSKSEALGKNLKHYLKNT
jgi:hypothetical protein